jgi:hypothetical protein
VTAHAREDEGLRSQRAQLTHHGLGDLADVGDAAAAAADRDDLSGFHAFAHLGTLKLKCDGAGDVGQPLRLELLANGEHARQRDVEPAGDVDFDAIGNHERPLDKGCPASTSVTKRGRFARAGMARRSTGVPGCSAFGWFHALRE